MKKKNKVIKFPKPKDLGKRLWGSEKLIALIPKKISLKILKIKKGSFGGLQYHRKKNECGYLISGRLLVKYDNGNGKLKYDQKWEAFEKTKIIKSGQSFHFPPYAVHQEKALTNCVIIEASTPHFNDRVRVEKKYGLKLSKGLPTTKIREIKFK